MARIRWLSFGVKISCKEPKVAEDISVSWVACDNSDCAVYIRTSLKKTLEEAIEAWNARAKDIDVRTK